MVAAMMVGMAGFFSIMSPMEASRALRLSSDREAYSEGALLQQVAISPPMAIREAASFSKVWVQKPDFATVAFSEEQDWAFLEAAMEQED